MSNNASGGKVINVMPYRAGATAMVAPTSGAGAAPPQSGAQEATSEDCLFLNVWTPGLGAAKKPLPNFSYFSR